MTCFANILFGWFYFSIQLSFSLCIHNVVLAKCYVNTICRTKEENNLTCSNKGGEDAEKRKSRRWRRMRAGGEEEEVEEM